MTRLMPATPDAFEALAARLRQAKTVQDRDHWLDVWIDYQTRATEWDADQWGLDPDRWMSAERAQMDDRAERAAARDAMQRSSDSQQGETE